MIRECIPLTALIITYNEEANIGRSLKSLYWIPNVLIIDSGSTDNTKLIAQKFSNVRLVHRDFDTFASQCNFALKTQITTEWVLSLDADYCLDTRISEEMLQLFKHPNKLETISGFRCHFTYCIEGYPLRGSLLPPRVCLYRINNAYYRDEGHGHRVVINGPVEALNGRILHDDRKPLTRWLDSQKRYMLVEATSLVSTPTKDLKYADKIRKYSVLAPIIVFLYAYIFKFGFLDGLPGFLYALQRVYAELLLLLILTQLRLANKAFPKLNRKS